MSIFEKLAMTSFLLAACGFLFVLVGKPKRLVQLGYLLMWTWLYILVISILCEIWLVK